MHHILLISPYWKEDHRWMVSTVKLADLWQRLGYSVSVLCMGRAKYESEEVRKCESVFSAEKISDTLTIYRVPDFFIPDPWNYGIAFGFSGHALALVRELKPDVIVVNKVLFWSSISLLRLRLAGYKVLLLTDALVGITWWPRSRIAKVCAALYAWTLGWLILAFASRIIFFHPQPEKILRRLGINKKSLVIPTGIDAALFASDPSPVPEGGEEGVTVTYIGRMESVKGADDFVHAALAAKKEISDLHIQAVGWSKPDHTLVRDFGDRVTFTGLRTDIAEILRTTDIFVLPSYSEGLSNALMEAMSAGCACIASDVGGNRFLIENGASGFLFPAGDREALASHIRRLAADSSKRHALSEAAQKRIADVFDWKIVGKKYDEFFTSWVSL